MNRLKQSLLALGVMALLPAIALAVPLSKDEQNCLNAVSKGLALIAKSQQKENASCIKNYAKGKSAASECTARDPKGKVDKLATLVAKKCPAPVAASIESSFGPDMLARAQGEGQNEPTRLSNAIFGLSLDEVVSLESDG